MRFGLSWRGVQGFLIAPSKLKEAVGGAVEHHNIDALPQKEEGVYS